MNNNLHLELAGALLQPATCNLQAALFAPSSCFFRWNYLNFTEF